MKNPIETIRLSQRSKDRLVALKRTMGMTQWNELCRWAFCISLADPNPPTERKITLDSSVEMTWKTFGGVQHEVYWALLCMRCKQDGLPLEPEVLKGQFRLHLHRGIASMAGNPKLKSTEDVVSLVADPV